MRKERIIGLGIVVVFAIIVAYFFISTSTLKKGEIPSYVTGEMRGMYEWAKSPEGTALLEQMPCYCGCKYEGHLHSRHCFWDDDGIFDKHGTTCSTCFNIAQKAKKLSEEGKSVCDIRNEIDAFYAPNKHLGTDTPMPEGCVAPSNAAKE